MANEKRMIFFLILITFVCYLFYFIIWFEELSLTLGLIFLLRIIILVSPFGLELFFQIRPAFLKIELRTRFLGRKHRKIISVNVRA